MSLTDSGLSASDVLALTANNNDGFGNGFGPYEQEVVHAGIRMIEQNR